MIRSRLVKHWRELRKKLDPVEAWDRISTDKSLQDYKASRGLGGFVRVKWDEALDIIAAANVHTIKNHGPDRVVGFSPIPDRKSTRLNSSHVAIWYAVVCFKENTPGTAQCTSFTQ